MMKRGYVICGYARTGSSLLAQALKATGCLGDPQEYFNPRAVKVATSEGYPDDASSQIAEIVKRGTSENGVYGLKIFCDQFDALRGFDWVSQLPKLHYVHLERRDTLGQAISWVRARQTVQWDSDQPLRGQMAYDERAIMEALARFSLHRARWTMFFARNGIEPLNLVYEDMVDSLPQAVQAIAAMVGIGGLPASSSGEKPLQIQRDDVSEEWRARFIGSRRDLSVLDDLKPVGGNGWLRGLLKLR
jgi:trehalose 2-sulfotransferase